MWAEAYARRTACERKIIFETCCYHNESWDLTCNRLHENLIERLNFVKKKLEGGSSDEEDEDDNAHVAYRGTFVTIHETPVIQLIKVA